MSHILESALTPLQRSEAEAADRAALRLTAADLDRHEAERIPFLLVQPEPAECCSEYLTPDDAPPRKWDSYDWCCLWTIVLCLCTAAWRGLVEAGWL